MSLWPDDLNKEGKEGSFKNTTTYPVWSAIENLLKHPQSHTLFILSLFYSVLLKIPILENQASQIMSRLN
jgi:hypothetical protein